jgi:hypothetical protein
MHCSKDQPFQTSLDQFVGAQQEGFRNRKTEDFGSGQIDHEIELGRLLDREVRRLGAKACAHAIRDITESEAAPTARCRNCLHSCLLHALM